MNLNSSHTAHNSANWWLNVIYCELALIYFFVPAGRFETKSLGFYISTGYDAYKLFPIIGLTWMIWRWRAGKAHRQKPQRLFLSPLLAFLGCAVLASFNSSLPGEAFPEALEWLAYLLFYCVMLDLPWSRQGLRWVAGGFVFGCFYLTAVALGQYVEALQTQALPRISATFDFPNALGVFTLFGITLLAWLFSHARAMWEKVALIAALGGVLFCLAASLSRAAFLGLLMWALVLWIFGNRRQKHWAAALLLSALVLTTLSAPQIIQRFQSTAAEFEHPQLVSRFYIWPAIMDAQAYKFSFFGVGLGPVISEEMADYNSAKPDRHRLNSSWHPHNLYLFLLFAVGPLGLFAYLWIYWNAFVALRAQPTPQSVQLMAGLTAFLLHQWFEGHLLLGNIPIALFTLLILTDRTGDGVYANGRNQNR